MHAEGSQSATFTHRHHEIDCRQAAAERSLHDGHVELQAPRDFGVLPHGRQSKLIALQSDKYAPSGACHHAPKRTPFNPDCPSQEHPGADRQQVVDAAAVHRCAAARRRTGELARRAGGISQKMLTQTLRELERHGIVSPAATTATVPPRVEYSLTALGRIARPASCGRSSAGWNRTTHACRAPRVPMMVARTG